MKRSPEDPRGPNLPSGEVAFGPPVVAPGVTDPQAIRYANALAARHPPKYTAPVAGGGTPMVPRLDLPAEPGFTMQDQALAQRAYQQNAPQSVPLPGPQAGSMFQAAAPERGPQRPDPARPPGILPNDTLPPEARNDPDFKEGHGSMYASAQPNLAHKYGVMRGGQKLAPQSIGQAPRTLSKETMDGLRAVQEAQSQRQTVDGEDARIEREAAAGAAGAAGRLGNAPTDGPAVNPQASQKNLVEAVKKLDDFDYNTFREMMMKDIINNDEQREVIEKRCKPLDITDLIMSGFVTQRVPIIPGKFEPEFRSMSGDEDLAIKRLVMAESKGVEVSERYLLDKFSMMSVTVGLFAVNGNPTPSHQDAKGNFDEEAFWKKFAIVTKYPFHMLASLGVNYFWFDIRVRKLFVAEKMGNG